MSLKTLAVLSISGLALATGCKETTSSENIRTGGIAMLTEVTARSASNARVRTELRVGGDESNTFVILEGGDRLVAEADGEEDVMEAIEEGIYEAEFDTGAGGTEFTVRLERVGDEDALDNHGTLPEPFSITSDFDSTPISRSEDEFDITWEPSGEPDDMEIDFDEDEGESCIYSADDEIGGDPGSYTVERDFLDSTSSMDPETCDVTATLTRSSRGSNDDALDGESSFVLKQVRSVSFVSAP
jgi:hypothetical protein